MASRTLDGLALCAGIGGLELGIHLAVPGYRAVCYVEREAYAAATLVARMEETAVAPAPVWGDLSTFDGRPWRGVVDLVSAGFPCQPFSAAGKKRGTDDDRWLWPHIERVLREVLPRWVVLENVPGLVRHGLGPVLGGLAALGYDAEWGLLRADAVGATHRRERFFCLARLADTERIGSDDTEAGGWRGAREAAGGSGGDVAHHESGGRGVERSEGVEGREGHAHGSDENLADGQRSGRGQGNGPGGVTRWRRQPEGEDRDVADPSLNGRPGSDVSVQPGRPDEAGASARWSRPLFPPGPGDLDMWSRVLAEAPSLEPALCRMADGASERMEYRTDRLRALGNGVVPIQAAYAVLALADRAGWDVR